MLCDIQRLSACTDEKHCSSAGQIWTSSPSPGHLRRSSSLSPSSAVTEASFLGLAAARDASITEDSVAVDSVIHGFPVLASQSPAGVGFPSEQLSWEGFWSPSVHFERILLGPRREQLNGSGKPGNR